MGRIDGIIRDDLDKDFRLRVVEKFGGKKGTLSIALEEAIERWLDLDDVEPTIRKKKSKSK